MVGLFGKGCFFIVNYIRNDYKQINKRKSFSFLERIRIG